MMVMLKRKPTSALNLSLVELPFAPAPPSNGMRDGGVMDVWVHSVDTASGPWLLWWISSSCRLWWRRWRQWRQWRKWRWWWRRVVAVVVVVVVVSTWCDQ